eukprot:1143499-Pelagomonas_calceolata.AAC.6
MRMQATWICHVQHAGIGTPEQEASISRCQKLLWNDGPDNMEQHIQLAGAGPHGQEASSTQVSRGTLQEA